MRILSLILFVVLIGSAARADIMETGEEIPASEAPTEAQTESQTTPTVMEDQDGEAGDFNRSVYLPTDYDPDPNKPSSTGHPLLSEADDHAIQGMMSDDINGEKSEFSMGLDERPATEAALNAKILNGETSNIVEACNGNADCVGNTIGARAFLQMPNPNHAFTQEERDNLLVLGIDPDARGNRPQRDDVEIEAIQIYNNQELARRRDPNFSCQDAPVAGSSLGADFRCQDFGH